MLNELGLLRAKNVTCLPKTTRVSDLLLKLPLNIQPVVVVRGFKRQQVAALTNFVGCFLLTLSYFFFLSFGAE